MTRATVLVFALAVAGIPHRASAQATMRDVVDLLVTNQSVQTGDFVKDRDAAQAASDTLARALLVSLSTLPASSSSAGFTYRFNPALGTLERTSTSFGPSFVERAVTSGRGQVALGGTWQYARFTRLDGRHLRDGTLVTTANKFTDEAAPFDEESLTLRMSSTVLTGFATVGVSDHVDIGVAVPFLWVNLEGERVDTYRAAVFTQAQATAETSGVGDVALRAKWHAVDVSGGGLGVIGELRLPTGRDEDLLGAGTASQRLMAIYSIEQGNIGVHGNAGLSWGGISDEFVYGAAVTVAAAPRVTIAGELSGRRLTQGGRLIDSVAAHPTIADVQTLRLAAADESAQVALGGISFKWNVGGAWLLRGSLLAPLTDAGLTSPVRVTLGIDYALAH
jgi:hypothetical protein